jgi:flagellar biosynthesis protein FlhG
LSGKGKRVIILDADFGLANIEVLFGVLPKYSLADILAGNKLIEEVLTEGPRGIKFISGGSGLRELANINDRQLVYLLENISRLDQAADIVLIDTGAGISKNVVNFIKASDETIIIATPEPTSITDAYALIKTVKEDVQRTGDRLPDFKLVINRTDDKNEGMEVYTKLSVAAERFLEVPLANLGSIPFDSNLIKAVKRQQPVIISAETCAASRAIAVIGDKLTEAYVKEGESEGKKDKADNKVIEERQGIKGFMKRLVNIFGN